MNFARGATRCQPGRGRLSLPRWARCTTATSRSSVKRSVLAGSHGKVISSIFVNPTQFGPAEDFTRYPRTLDADLELLRSVGCDAVFVPSAQEMYPTLHAPLPHDLAQGVSIDPGPLAALLDGAVRPGHFRGVCTVVAKLLHIVQPTDLLLGQKDFQQQAILRRMCADLNMNIAVMTCPTVRESDGLALSSRNRYLSPEDRPRAGGIFKAMEEARRTYSAGERRAAALEETMQTVLAAHALQIQYAVVAQPETLQLWSAQPQGVIAGDAILLVAAKVPGGTRLIDNMPPLV